MDETAVKALSDWLQGNQFDWKYFFTVTYRDPRPEHWAETSVQQAHTLLRQHHPGHMFIGCELHSLGTLHLHGLLEKPAPVMYGPIAYDVSEGVRRRTWKHLWDRWGRADVQYVRSLSAVADYVSDYVTKKLVWWNLW